MEAYECRRSRSDRLERCEACPLPSSSGRRAQWPCLAGASEASGARYSGVVDEVVEPGLPKNPPELLWECTDIAEAAHVKRDDVLRALRAALQVDKHSRFVGLAGRRNEEVPRGLDKLPNKFEANVAESSGNMRAVLVRLSLDR